MIVSVMKMNLFTTILYMPFLYVVFLSSIFLVSIKLYCWYVIDAFDRRDIKIKHVQIYSVVYFFQTLSVHRLAHYDILVHAHTSLHKECSHAYTQTSPWAYTQTLSHAYTQTRSCTHRLAHVYTHRLVHVHTD